MCRTRCGGPRTPLRTNDANLDYALVENAFLFVVPKFGEALDPLGPPVLDPKTVVTWYGKYDKCTKNQPYTEQY